MLHIKAYVNILKKLQEDITLLCNGIQQIGGGTDAGSIHVANEGIPTISIGVALRYMHSNVSVLHTDDYENSVRLVTEIVRSLNDDAYERIKW